MFYHVDCYFYFLFTRLTREIVFRIIVVLSGTRSNSNVFENDNHDIRHYYYYYFLITSPCAVVDDMKARQCRDELAAKTENSTLVFYWAVVINNTTRDGAVDGEAAAGRRCVPYTAATG